MATRKYIVDIFEDIVEDMRQTGTITTSAEVSGTYTITSVNELIDGWHVTINSVTYEVYDPTADGFTIKGETGLNLEGETWTALEPYYDYGHILDVVAKLTAKDGNDIYKFQKYPLVVLLTDIEEAHGDSADIEYTCSPSLLILDKTEASYTSQDRMQLIFKPILYPIYDSLIDSVKYSEYLNVLDQVPHKKTDRMAWGSSSVSGNTATIFTDYLDGIEIEFDNIGVFSAINTCE